MLAFQQGGASTPTGALPTFQNVAGGVASSAQQAQGTAESIQSVAQSKAQTEVLQQQNEKLKAETINAQASAANIAADTELKLASAGKTDADAANSRASLLGVTAKSAAEADQYNADADHGDGRESAFAARARKTKAEADRTAHEARHRKAQAINEELETSRERAYSDYYNTKIGKSEPYLNLGADIVTSASQLKRAFSPKRAR